MAEMLGTTVGGQQLLSQLGEGGMGVVYRAVDTVLGRTTVVKMLRSEWSQDREMVARFFQEAKAASAVRHPGVIQVHSFGFHDDGSAYIVMELLVGESLEARIQRVRALPRTDALRITRQIAGVLEATHAQGIVHRDLKPDNVFVLPDPDSVSGERIKVLDFGIAKLSAGGAPGLATRTGTVMGTPAYMAPEQCRGAAVDARTDLYAVGCMLFQMLSGRTPFEGTITELVAAQLRDPPPPLRMVAPAIDPPLEALVARLLEKDPALRTPSASALVAAIDGLPPSTLPAAAVAASSVAAAPTRSGAFPWILVALAAAVVLAVVVMALMMTGGRGTTPGDTAAAGDVRLVAGRCSDGNATFASGPVAEPSGTPARSPSPLFESPLQQQAPAMQRCIAQRRSTVRSGAFAVELATDSGGMVVSNDVSGPVDRTLQECLGKTLPARIAGLPPGTTLRCAFAYGTLLDSDVHHIDIGERSIDVDGAKVLDTSGITPEERELPALTDVLQREVERKLAEARTHRVAVSGPWLIRPHGDTSVANVVLVARAALRAGASTVLTARRGQAWTPLRPLELPMEPTVIGAAQLLSPLKLRGASPGVLLSILVTEDKLFIAPTVPSDIYFLTYPLEPGKLAEVLTELRATPELSTATAFELAYSRPGEVPFVDMLALIDALAGVGFTDGALTDPSALTRTPLL